MAIYNTQVAIVANLPAASEADAIKRLTAAVERAGFVVMDSEAGLNNAFEAEAGTEATHALNVDGRQPARRAYIREN